MFVLTNEAVTTGAARAAAWLASKGARPGDRIAVVGGNHPAYVELTSGALRSGVVPVLLDPKAADVKRLLADCDPALVVTDDAWPDLSGYRGVDLADHPLARPMHYTSGTTGLSKGVWSGVLDEAAAGALAADERDLWDARPGETYLVCSPLYHSAPHRAALSALGAGARVVVFERFEALDVARAFAEEAVAGAFLVPTHLRRLLAGPLAAPHARRILHAGEPCPEPLRRRAIEAFGAGNLWEFYGSTEGQFTLCSAEEWLDRPRTVGRARAGRELSVRDPAPDGVGTVYVTAPSFARWSYWRDPDQTARAWDGDRFTVGDLGRLDDGYLYLEGRREDLIITGGVNVYPAEVERVILSHPGVVEAAVFGVPDDHWGQRVCAVFVGEAAAGELGSWLRGRLAPAQLPKQLSRIASLPRTETGKIRRSELAAEA